MSALEVWWEEEPHRRRKVTRGCKRCVVDRQRASLEHFHIVSPSGLAHLAHEFSEGSTACGHDATGKDWWWET